jgi:predicted transcriptional regulator
VDHGIAIVSGSSYAAPVKGITVKFSDATLERLRKEARAAGRSVSAMIRDCVDNQHDRKSRSVYELTADLAGSVRGGRRPASNHRRRFRRS